jgi:hypothetical protein
MVASCSVASAACATISVCGRGADSSTSVDRSSSPTAASGSSPFQDRLVDFLHNTTPMIRQARLSIYMNYSEIGYTHKLDRTTVTVGAPSMLAISTIPASAGTSSWATTGSIALVVAEGSSLLFSVDAVARRRQPLAMSSRHRRFSGGGWTAAPLSRRSHRVPGFFILLVHGVV